MNPTLLTLPVLFSAGTCLIVKYRRKQLPYAWMTFPFVAAQAIIYSSNPLVIRASATALISALYLIAALPQTPRLRYPKALAKPKHLR